MASAECCTGTLNPGEPVGHVETLYDFPTYISDPPEGAEARATIVIFPDAFGWEFPNNRILADTYAKRLQMRVLLPEMMDGKAMNWGVAPDLEVFLDKRIGFMTRLLPTAKAIATMGPFLYRTRATLVKPRVEAYMQAVRAAVPSTHKIGTAGFCWGALYVFTLSSSTAAKTPDGRHLYDAGYTAHPSQLTLPADAEAATVPISVAIGGADIVAGKDAAKAIEPVWAKKGGEAEGWELTVTEGARHGFAVRGNPDVPEELEAQKKAEDQAVAYFSKWLIAKE